MFNSHQGPYAARSSPSPSRSPRSPRWSPTAQPAAGRRPPPRPRQGRLKGHNGDYYGYVKSSDADNCANGRKVKVFKQPGSDQDPKNDQKIGTDTAQANGDGYMWSIGNSGYKHGKFYAKVGKTDSARAIRRRRSTARQRPHSPNPVPRRLRPPGRFPLWGGQAGMP